PEVIPPEAAEILLAVCRLMEHQQVLGTLHLAILPGSGGEVDVNRVDVLAQGRLPFLGPLAVGFRPDRVFLSQPRPINRNFVLLLFPPVGGQEQNRIHDRRPQGRDEGGNHRPDERPVAAGPSRRPVSRGRGPGLDRFVVQVPLDVPAKASAVWYRRLRSFSRAFIPIQSSSWRSIRLSLAGSTWRRPATDSAFAPRVRIRVLGRGGSSSRMTRRISSYPASRSRF